MRREDVGTRHAASLHGLLAIKLKQILLPNVFADMLLAFIREEHIAGEAIVGGCQRGGLVEVRGTDVEQSTDEVVR